MQMHLRLGIAVALGLAGLVGPALAETKPLGCGELAALVSGLTGYDLTLPPAPDVDGVCVAEGAVLRAEGRPRILVQELSLSGTARDAEPASVSLTALGLRVVPDLGDREMDARLRSMLRLQTADVELTLLRPATGDGLQLRGGKISLSGGSELQVEAAFSGGGFSAAGMVSAALLSMRLDWRNDGRLLRPVMEAAGAELQAGATGAVAIDATRAALVAGIEALPAASLAGETQDELQAMVAALPQGQGRAVLDISSDAGIGATGLAMLALSDNPAGPEALARFLAGTEVALDWQPGIAP